MSDYALDDGSCKFLNADNSCKIYATRPRICRVDQMQKESKVSKDIYYKSTAVICNDFQEKANAPIKFRVIL